MSVKKTYTVTRPNTDIPFPNPEIWQYTVDIRKPYIESGEIIENKILSTDGLTYIIEHIYIDSHITDLIELQIDSHPLYEEMRNIENQYDKDYGTTHSVTYDHDYNLPI